MTAGTRVTSVVCAVAGVLALTAPAASAAPVGRGTRTSAHVRVEPVCTDRSATLRVRLAGLTGVARLSTTSGVTYTYRPWDPTYPPPVVDQLTGWVDLAEPAGRTTIEAQDADGRVLGRATATATTCDGWQGLAGYLASGADEIGRPLYLGELSSTPQRWPDGTLSYAGTAGDLWVRADGTAHALTGDVARTYRRLGGPTGTLGLPATSVQSEQHRLRSRTWFTGGVVKSDHDLGTHAVSGPLADGACTVWDLGEPDPRYAPQTLDYPTSDVFGPLRGGGYGQHHEHGSVYAVPGQGCVPVWNGPVRDYWASTGWEAGPLGYPLVASTPGPDETDFEGGAVFQLAGATPAAPRGVVVVGEPFLTGWRAAAGDPLSTTGTPQTFVTRTPNGAGEFVAGTAGVLYRSAAGMHVVSTTTGFLGRWGASGYESGPLGFPAGDAFRAPQNWSGSAGVGQRFQGGVLYRVGGSGDPHAVRGAILDRWASLGYEQSPLGFPVGDEVEVPGGVRQEFQGGALTWDAATGKVT